MLIVARQAQQESCLFGGLDENDRKFSIWKGYSRAINYQTVLSRPVRRATILSWGGARSFKCYSQTGLLHFSLSYSAEKVNLDLWSKEFMFGRGVRWYLVQIYYCGAALHRMIELRKETLQKKKKRIMGECHPKQRPRLRRRWLCWMPWSWKTNLQFPHASET